MRFEKELVRGRLIRRYKRFLADVVLDDGTEITAHCTNSGSMASCLEVGAPVLLSEHDNPNRRTRHTWEMILINNMWVGVNTMNANILAYELVRDGLMGELGGFRNIRKEVAILNSRIDLAAENDDGMAYFEVKNVSMKDGHWAAFPDAVTKRGKKHLETLIQLRKEGHVAAMIYIIQRQDISRFRPASAIDPDYADTLRNAYRSGVDIIPVRTILSENGIQIDRKLPFDLGR